MENVEEYLFANYLQLGLLMDVIGLHLCRYASMNSITVTFRALLTHNFGNAPTLTSVSNKSQIFLFVSQTVYYTSNHIGLYMHMSKANIYIRSPLISKQHLA